MAPIATQPVESTETSKIYQKGTGAYKEQSVGAEAYDAKLEEEGTADRPAAQVLTVQLTCHGAKAEVCM